MGRRQELGSCAHETMKNKMGFVPAAWPPPAALSARVPWETSTWETEVTLNGELRIGDC